MVRRLAWRNSVRVVMASNARVAGSSDPERMKAAAKKAGIAMKLSVQGQSLEEEGFKVILAKASGEEVVRRASNGGHLASNLVVKTEE